MQTRRIVLISLLLSVFYLVFACSNEKTTSPELTVDSALTTLSKAGTSSVSSTDWGYAGDIGPAQWCFLDPDFELCCEGMEQSPVDITNDALKFAHLPRLKFHYAHHADLEVVNNGHTVEAEVHEGDGMLTIGDKSYTLLQFHFHTMSEHAVGGRLLPMEMHLVHKAEDGSLAVVGVFIVRGREHEELEKIWADLPEHGGDHGEVEGFDLNKLLPRNRNTFRYGGSLTTPPCSQGVSWNIFARPISMSEGQIHDFVEIFSGEEFPNGNRRPVQPLNGRDLLTDLRQHR